MKKPFEQAIKVFRAHKGVMRTKEALAAGIHRRTLYAMKKEREVVMLSRGVFRLADLPPLENPDIATVAKRIPQGVVCLISALALHKLTTQIPHEVHLAIERGRASSRIDYPPVKFYRFGKAAYKAGLEVHTIDGVPVKVYSPEKTLADCFKYRNRIGINIFQEALKAYRQHRKPNFDKLLEYAKVCRVERNIRPHLEAIL